MGDKGSPPAKRARPFPKQKVVDSIGKRNTRTDFDRLRTEYLDGPDYDFAAFCRRQNYPVNFRWMHWDQYGVDIKAWKREWLREKAGIQDDKIAEELLEVRDIVARTRMAYVKDWTRRSAYLKALLDGMLKSHGDALMRDQQNTLEIQAGRRQREFKLDVSELVDLAHAAERIQNVEVKSVLIITNLPGGQSLEQKESEKEDDSPDFQITTMEGAGLTAKESAKFLSEYFDQVEKPKELPAPPVEVKSEPQDNG